MNPIRPPLPRLHHQGFSLVEIMVAVVIGMFGIIIMMQVFALSEERKRTTTSGNDSVTEGVMALYAVQRDVRQAGYGFSDVKALGCNLLLRAGVTLNSLAPVTINHASITGQDANTDTLIVAYGNTTGSPQGDGITTSVTAGGTSYTVQTPASFFANDWIVATPAIANPEPRTAVCNVILNRVAAAPTATITVTSPIVSSAETTIFNFGQTPRVMAYAVRGGNLTMCDYLTNNCGNAADNGNSAIWVPVANNVVSLRAQYGRDTATAITTFSTPPSPLPNYVVNTFDQTTPAANNDCGWARIDAVRLVLVARSAQLEKTAVTAAAPTWEGSAAAPIDLTATSVPTGQSWQNYRYRVFPTVVPLRNVAWMGVQSGC